MPISIILKPIKSYLRGSLRSDIYKKIDTLLSYREHGAEFIPSYKNKLWDGRIRLFCMDDLSFPTGLSSRLIKFFNDFKIEYNIVDERPISNKQFDWKWKSKIIKSLHPYQMDAVGKIFDKKYGVIQAGTGAGKTIIMAKSIQELGRKTLVLVHKIDLLEQARDKISECLGIDVGYIGNGELNIKDVTVGTVQTIVKSLGYKYNKFMDEEIDEKLELKEQDKERVRQLLREVNVVIIDECHHVRSETQQNIMANVSMADYRIGLSATPMRDQGDDLLIEGIFGDILCKISATYLIENGFLVRPYIRFNNINYTEFNFFEIIKIDKENNIIYYNPQPSTGSNTGRRREIDVVWDTIANRNKNKLENFKDNDILYEFDNGSKILRKWNNYKGNTDFVHHIYIKLEEICSAAFEDVLNNEENKLDDKTRNEVFVDKEKYAKFVKKVRRKYPELKMKGKYAFIYDACITDNEYRNMFIAQLINIHNMENRSVLILVTRLRHGDNIIKILLDDVIFLKGEDDIDIRNKAMNMIRNKELKEIIASTIADEGLDLPALDTVIMAGGGTSKTTALQRVGRAIRIYPGKEKAYIEEFYDDAQYLKNHSNDRKDIYKTEPGFIIIESTNV
jgi:superfamily II DNA or RNA helicase